MESNNPVVETPAKNNRTPLIIGIAAIVLCCCCAIGAGVASYGYGIIRSAETQTVPTEDVELYIATPSIDSDPGGDFGAGEAPTGGLGNDILRNDTWQYVAAAAVGQGCDRPIGAETLIEVVQQPTDGMWVEKWTVACASGDTYAYEIEFVPDATGVNFTITSLP